MSDGADPLAAMNAVLDEIIDFVREVKQARWRFGASATLHRELDSLFEDAREWARRLMQEDEDHGVPALGSVPTASTRDQPYRDVEAASAEEIRGVLEEILGRLDGHVASALALQVEPHLRSALSDVEVGVRGHRDALSAP